MLELVQLALLAFNSIALAIVAINNYRQGNNKELLSACKNCISTYLLMAAVILLLGLALPDRFSFTRNMNQIMAGNISVDITGPLFCLPLLLLAAVSSLLFLRIPGNSSKLAYILFLLAISQLLWFALTVPYSYSPKDMLMLLSVWDIVGIFVIYAAGYETGKVLQSTSFFALAFSKDKTLQSDTGRLTWQEITPARAAGMLIVYSVYNALFALFMFWLGSMTA